jgi:myo-inositol 2-dehydrogenase / D-chiro-inositol 1-dehydrogenase
LRPWQAPLTSKDTGQPQAFSVTGNFTSNLDSADREKKKAFIESITSGNFHNQAEKGTESALSCMMARQAAYSGREVTWDELLKSREVFDAKLDISKLA